MVRFALACVLIAGCKFQATAAPGDGPPDSAIDAQVIDAAIDAAIDAPPPPDCTAMSAQCLDAVTLSTCSGANATPVVTTCNWGCVPTNGAHCGQLAPEGGAVNSSDITASNTDISTSSAVTINTGDGSITGITGFTHVLRGNVQIFEFHGVTLNGPVTIVGPNAAAIVADGPIVIGGVVDARGPCAMMPNKGGPGGFNGGPADMDGMGMGGGGAGTSKNDGGGGAGHGGAGGAAGQGGGGGGSYGASFSVLVGGSGGGGGHNMGHDGGGGGGAVQLVSNTSITIASNGGINAGGCGGKSTSNDTANGGAGGGGAGGTILIEAPTVIVNGALAVNGGAGGGSTTRGGDATLDRNMAMNGDGGGAGGAAAMATGQSGTKPGGGGGAVGRMHFDTRTGNVMVNGTMSPAFADPGTLSTKAAATVQ